MFGQNFKRIVKFIKKMRFFDNASLYINFFLNILLISYIKIYKHNMGNFAHWAKARLWVLYYNYKKRLYNKQYLLKSLTQQLVLCNNYSNIGYIIVNLEKGKRWEGEYNVYTFIMKKQELEPHIKVTVLRKY